jgi:hypothetical protein
MALTLSRPRPDRHFDASMADAQAARELEARLRLQAMEIEAAIAREQMAQQAAQFGQQMAEQKRVFDAQASAESLRQAQAQAAQQLAYNDQVHGNLNNSPQALVKQATQAARDLNSAEKTAGFTGRNWLPQQAALQALNALLGVKGVGSFSANKDESVNYGLNGQDLAAFFRGMNQRAGA